MITEQTLLSIYAVLLVELGLLLMLLIIIVLDIKNTVDSVRRLINKFVKLGHITVDSAEEIKSKLTSFSGVTSIVSKIPAIISLVKTWNNKSQVQDDTQEDNDIDDLGEALNKVTPKKKRRII
ncbi:MAG: hypothetical protein ACO3UU_07530 [Minisyncoccia bacterium]